MGRTFLPTTFKLTTDMTTKEKITQCLKDMAKAEIAFIDAIKEGLERYGELPMLIDEEDGNECFRMFALDKHDNWTCFGIDKARLNKDALVPCVEFHVFEQDYDGADYWCPSYIFASEETWAMENIDFPEED